ncbi:MAG: hypothetical protein WC421_11455 [Elusimicrobiales bacterium]
MKTKKILVFINLASLAVNCLLFFGSAHEIPDICAYYEIIIKRIIEVNKISLSSEVSVMLKQIEASGDAVLGVLLVGLLVSMLITTVNLFIALRSKSMDANTINGNKGVQ